MTRFQLHRGDSREVLKTLAESSVDSIVTDPPYHLTTGKKGGTGPASVNLESPYGRARVGTGFMGMKWDGGQVAHDPALWAEALRVAKPGAHLVAFGGSRTFHRLACAIEDAGWELRDTGLRGHTPEDCPWLMAWAYGSGFPKSHNGDWGGTALKPAWEPIVMARKPLIGTVEANWREYGTGALNIDACRVDAGEGRPLRVLDAKDTQNNTYAGRMDGGSLAGGSKAMGETSLGRWPANLLHDGSDAVLAAFPDAPGQQGDLTGHSRDRTSKGIFGDMKAARDALARGDEGSAARFFYCAKASKEDREEGLSGFAERQIKHYGQTMTNGNGELRNGDGSIQPRANHHPTVKPTELMRWLVRLVTPAGGTVLDPFTGSGSTGKAAMLEGMRFVGIDLDSDDQGNPMGYLDIARARIDFALRQGHQPGLL